MALITVKRAASVLADDDYDLEADATGDSCCPECVYKTGEHVNPEGGDFRNFENDSVDCSLEQQLEQSRTDAVSDSCDSSNCNAKLRADSISNSTASLSNCQAASRQRAMRSRAGTASSAKSISLSASARLVRENFVVVKGAAVILSSSCDFAQLCATDRPDPEIQSHLQAIFKVLKPNDTIRAAVRLDSKNLACIKYAAVVCRIGMTDQEESIVLGLDILPPQEAAIGSSTVEKAAIRQRAFVGVVLPLFADAEVKLNGDGGFSVSSNEHCHVFKPVSVQAMWSALQTLDRAVQIARRSLFHPAGLTHTWTTVYEALLTDNDSLRVADWNRLDEVTPTVGVSRSLADGDASALSNGNVDSMENTVRSKLREVMLTVDLEEVNTKYLRERLEAELATSLAAYRTLIDEEAIVVMGQLEKASEIFDYLFLGSEWNASNWDELRANGVTHIVNVSREVDCFFPNAFQYLTVRVYDTADADLLVFWDRTFRFMADAHHAGGRVLVHCKMGISRSASTVVAYCMKERGWPLSEALRYVKRRRACIKPNDNFMRQLDVYAGIVEASRQRHNPLFAGDAEPESDAASPDAEADSPASVRRPQHNRSGSLHAEDPPSHVLRSRRPRNKFTSLPMPLRKTRTSVVLDSLRFSPGCSFTSASEPKNPAGDSNRNTSAQTLASNSCASADAAMHCNLEPSWLPGAVKRRSRRFEARSPVDAVCAQQPCDVPVDPSPTSPLTTHNATPQAESDTVVKPGTVRDLVRVFGEPNDTSALVSSTFSKRHSQSQTLLDIDRTPQARYSWPSPLATDALHTTETCGKQLPRCFAGHNHAPPNRVGSAAVNIDLQSNFSRDSVAYITL